MIAMIANPDWIDLASDLMRRGGPVMIPIAICSFIAVLIALRKLLQWTFYRLHVRLGRSEWDTVIQHLTNGSIKELSALRTSSTSPYTRLLFKAWTNDELSSTDVKEALERQARNEVRRLKRGLGVLDTIVTLAPLLGILGTVTGIISSFNLMGNSGIEDPAGVTSGIAEALITTAAGLIVSILALLPLNYGRAWCRETTRDLEEAMTSAEQRITENATK